MEPINLFTIGYEKQSVEDFIDKLQCNSVRILVDVRERAASRKPGFSKKKLKETLESVGIKYVHVKELGSPKDLRQKLYQDNDYEYFFKGYREFIETKMQEVESLYNETIINEASCLMCMERLPANCHRTVVAEKIKEVDGNGLIIKHI